ncbi:MAG: DUF5304 family protein [Streptosporangiaceae bacterium]
MNERHGSLAGETARLIETVQTLLRYSSASSSGHGDVWSEATNTSAPGVATGDPECRLCPFCQLLGFGRHARPTVFNHLVAAGDEVLAAVREAFDAHEQAWTGPRSTGIEHIDVS